MSEAKRLSDDDLEALSIGGEAATQVRKVVDDDGALSDLPGDHILVERATALALVEEVKALRVAARRAHAFLVPERSVLGRSCFEELDGLVGKGGSR